MKGRALILIFLFLILLCTPVSANIFTNPSFETSEIGGGKTPSGWTHESSEFYTEGTFNNTGLAYDGENYYYLHDGSWIETGGLHQSVDLTGVDAVNIYTKMVNGHSNSFFELSAGGLDSKRYGSHDWEVLTLDVSSLSGVHSVRIYAVLMEYSNTYFYIDLAYDGDLPYPDTIQLNQSSYNDPENIRIDAELPNYDPTNYSYTTRLYGYTYGGWGALTQVDYNESTAMTASTKSIVADINTDWYDLPLYIKAVITRFDKSDYSTTETAESDMVYYNLAQGNTEGEINLNQTYYTDPENIEVEWNITGYNTTFFNYEIQVITSISGDPSQDSWPADGNWNTSPFISSASGAAVFDFYSDGYDLPIWIQGELWAQDKNIGTWTKLDNTPVVIYHKDTGDASISLNATYDVGDIALITWQAADEDADLIIQFTNLNTSYIHTMEPYIWIPGIQKFEKYFTNEYIGKIKVELIENGVTTAVAYTMVSSPTTPYIEWYNSEIPLGTDAYYSYYTDNSSDTIAIYGPNLDLDPPVFNELFNIFSAETGHHYLYTTTGGKDAGVWTISLLHDGTTYYNDTMMVTTADAFVRFDGDEFEMGDTIGITYQLSDFTDEIWMFDANNKMVVQFTCQWGALSIGGVRTVDYSLVDSNEYGHNIESLISAGHYETGTWKIYIVRNGILTSESDEWDITTIKSATSDPADTSNEMISIFFSPEGAFMLYTVCLTMMGLVLAKHPAGGGAGATVGVGFGTYFNVLPVWMLMLTVILLVVMAGVSIAVYYKGK